MGKLTMLLVTAGGLLKAAVYMAASNLPIVNTPSTPPVMPPPPASPAVGPGPPPANFLFDPDQGIP